MAIIFIFIFFAFMLYINDNKQRSAFCMGWIVAFCAVSLHQDGLGKEAYIKLVSESWIQSSYTMPAAAVMIVLCMLSIRESNRTTISVTISKDPQEKKS